jgi:DNA (cytosine-5)-methyltransferase 1
MTRAFYNDNDVYAAQWLRNLIGAGLIEEGEVDARSVLDVEPADLDGFGHCHFFAGIGGWAQALDVAGWPGGRDVWTLSCPCQPLSCAGQRQGDVDERHLWPAVYRLIAERRPATLFGEQVASKDGREWFAAVRTDLEGLGYAVGAADLCAAGVGAPHIRQRLFFVADAAEPRRDTWRRLAEPGGWRESSRLEPGRLRDAGVMAAAESLGLLGRPDERDGGRRQRASGQGRAAGQLEHAASNGRDEGRPEPGQRGPLGGCGDGELGDADSERLERRPDRSAHAQRREIAQRSSGLSSGNVRPGAPNRLWRDCDWLYCTDGKWRPVEPQSFPLAHGIRNRASQLRAYGNAIVPQLAGQFIAAFLDLETITLEARS